MFQLPNRVRHLLPERKRVVDPATERDRRIARSLQEMFEFELALSDIGGLQFFVHQGSVVLKGSLSSESDRAAVIQMIADLPDVRKVIDHLDRPARAA